MKILVVEDDKFLADAYAVKLGNAGHTALVVEDAVIAEKTLADFLPELIILDLMLPVKYGLEFLKWLKEQPAYKRIPVMVVTNVDKPADKEKAKKYGIVRYILKTEKNLDEILADINQLFPDSTRG